jgi:nitrite reductase (NO-forming)
MSFAGNTFAVVATAAIVTAIVIIAPQGGTTETAQAGDHATMLPGTISQTGEMDAEKNMQPPTVPAYKPGPQRVHFDMHEKVMEIAPGKVVKAWTFGDKAPGPTIRVRVGDTVDASITNKGDLPHSIDFHAARIAPNRAFRDVAPGETFRFSFTPTDPGVFMYHCGTPPVQHHIANGMYGMIIVEPKGGLPPVDQEIGVVQADWYVSPTAGAPTPDDRLMTGIPDVITFNGYAAQYKDKPIAVKKGTDIRAFVLNAGPNEPSAFHIVGTILDRVWLDGIRPENLNRGNQTANLIASQGAVVEFTLSEEGVYPMVTHEFTNAAKGGVALLKTEKAAAGGGHG